MSELGASGRSQGALALGATIGILGGGQLGRMLAVAAARLGFKAHIFEPGAQAPAKDTSYRVTTASYDDQSALRNFAGSVDVATFEFENIPASALDDLAKHVELRPNRRALETTQDRLREKEFLQGLGLRTAVYAPVSSLATLREAKRQITGPAILKTRSFGYDGKGQFRLDDQTDLDEALADISGAPAILEGLVPFSREVSVIGVRGCDGQVACFDPGENLHQDGILRQTTVPAPLSSAQRVEAVLLTGRILNALDYIGVLGVELFVTAEGMVVNEIAPRVHNSGHWTQNGCVIDQFEQHIRAIAGWPLGDGGRHCDVVMENLIGEDVGRLPELRADPNVALHLYGKADVKPGRKMGHFNRIFPKNQGR